MRNTNFTTKEEYLAYRAQWKADYKELTQDIRNLKWLRAARCQAHSSITKDLRKPDGEYYWKLIEGVKKYLNEIPRYGEFIKKYFGNDPYWIEGELQNRRDLATAMIEELHAAKARSYQMKQQALVSA